MKREEKIPNGQFVMIVDKGKIKESISGNRGFKSSVSRRK